MDFEKMELDELKNYAKSIGLTVGNIGKEKLIAKLKEKELTENNDTSENVEQKVTTEATDDTLVEQDTSTVKSNNDLLSSIASAIWW